MPPGKGARDRRRLNRIGLQQNWAARSHEPASLQEHDGTTASRHDSSTGSIGSESHPSSPVGGPKDEMSCKASAGMALLKSWGEANKLRRASEPSADAHVEERIWPKDEAIGDEDSASSLQAGEASSGELEV